MKLRKALDKAKRERDERSLTSTALKPVMQVGVGGDQWSPPVYSQSRPVELNKETLMKNRCICIEPDAIELENYKVLRTKILQATRGKGWRTVMITSVQPGEGKTLTTVNLALTFAKSYNQTVLLVDCDLRRQSVQRVLGIESAAGLADYLVDGKPLRECIIWPGIDKLTLISGGRRIQNSTELLGSSKMKMLVEEMKNRYDDRYVLFDVPPILAGADALTLAPSVDCVILVVEQGRTGMRGVEKAVEMIPREKFLGFVLNRQKEAGADGYGYYYYR